MKSLGSVLSLMLMAILAGRTALGDQSRPEAARRILVFGDSLSTGYGLSAQEAFPARLQQALCAAGYAAEVINAGVSGDTTAGGLARLDWTLAEKPDLIILELGANDALRGLDPNQTRANLDAMLSRLREAGVKILLAGMLAPRNLGSDYYNRFDAIYPALAQKYRVAFYPFFLEGVAGKVDLNQSDGIHPNAQGVDVIVGGILPTLKGILGSAGGDL